MLLKAAYGAENKGQTLHPYDIRRNAEILIIYNNMQFSHRLN